MCVNRQLWCSASPWWSPCQCFSHIKTNCNTWKPRCCGRTIFCWADEDPMSKFWTAMFNPGDETLPRSNSVPSEEKSLSNTVLWMVSHKAISWFTLSAYLWSLLILSFLILGTTFFRSSLPILGVAFIRHNPTHLSTHIWIWLRLSKMLHGVFLQLQPQRVSCLHPKPDMLRSFRLLLDSVSDSSVAFILSIPSMHAWGLVLCGVRRETGMGCDQMGVCVRVWNIGVETGIIGKRGGHAHEMSVKHGHG